MKLQSLSSGITVVVLGDPVPYQSPLRIAEVFPSVVVYEDAITGKFVGKVYQDDSGRWFLETVYLNPDLPLEIFAKYKGFLLLNTLHEKHGQRQEQR
jgi:hypothetical protein